MICYAEKNRKGTEQIVKHNLVTPLSPMKRSSLDCPPMKRSSLDCRDIMKSLVPSEKFASMC